MSNPNNIQKPAALSANSQASRNLTAVDTAGERLTQAEAVLDLLWGKAEKMPFDSVYKSGFWAAQELVAQALAAVRTISFHEA